MPKIDHEERKHQILAMSVKLFAKYGYSAVNFGMLAKELGLARTLLYTYFKNKRAIFNYSIDDVTKRVEAKYAEVVHSRQPVDTKLRQICMTVLAMLFDNREFVCVIADVLAAQRRKGGIPVDKVDEHTRGLKRILRLLLGEAVRRGEYRADINPLRVTNLLYSQFEAAALRLTITGRAEISHSIDLTDAILNSLCVKG